MPSAPKPPDESARLTLLHGYAILDTPHENTFEQLVARAADLFGAPMAALTLVDRGRVWAKATYGLPLRELPRDIAFCSHTILADDVLVSEDAASDPRFADNPLVLGSAHVRFYAGAPLISPGKGRLGALCVMDRVPRPVTAAQTAALVRLAREAMIRLQVRLALLDATEVLVLREAPVRLLPAPAE